MQLTGEGAGPVSRSGRLAWGDVWALTWVVVVATVVTVVAHALLDPISFRVFAIAWGLIFVGLLWSLLFTSDAAARERANVEAERFDRVVAPKRAGAVISTRDAELQTIGTTRAQGARPVSEMDCDRYGKGQRTPLRSEF